MKVNMILSILTNNAYITHIEIYVLGDENSFI